MIICLYIPKKGVFMRLFHNNKATNNKGGKLKYNKTVNKRGKKGNCSHTPLKLLRPTPPPPPQPPAPPPT